MSEEHEKHKAEAMQSRFLVDIYNIKGQLAQVVVAAFDDTDRVSMLACGERKSRPDFAVVVIKGHQEIEAFRRWAHAQKLLTPGKSVDGLLEVFEADNGC